MLTEGDGTHEVEYSPDRRFLIDTLFARRPAAGHRAAAGRATASSCCELERADASALRRDGLAAARAVRRQGARRQDRHLRRDLPADELRPVEEIPGDRGDLRRAAGGVRARRRSRRSTGRRRWPSWASSSSRSTGWGRTGGRRRSTTSAGRTSATPASPTASSG